MLSNIPVVLASSHMHLAEPPVLLNTSPAKFVNMRAIGSPYAGVVEPSNCKRQSLPGNLEDTIASDEEEGKQTK